jgi:phage terminase large subunit GpA-like protein
VPPGENWIVDPPAGGLAIPAATLDVARAAADAGDAELVARLPYAVYPFTHRPTTVCGFWRSALYWIWVSWGEQAVKYLDARGSPEKALNFQRRIDGRPFQPPEDQAGMEPAEVEAHIRAGYVWQTVPAEADVLTITVDVQGGYVYYVVRGWRSADGASWLVDVGTTKETHQVSGLPGGLEFLARRAAEGWPRAGGQPPAAAVSPRLTLIDGRYMPDLVFRHCVRYGLKRWRPIQGQHRPGELLPIWAPRPAGVKGRWYWPVGVNEAKTLLWKLLQSAPGQPGYWHMPEGIPPRTLVAYTRHMTSEVWDEAKRRWVRRKELKTRGMPAERAGRNDWWDCETYQIAAAIACGVKLPALTPPPRERSAEAQNADRPAARASPHPNLPQRRPGRWRSPGIRRVY